MVEFGSSYQRRLEICARINSADIAQVDSAIGQENRKITSIQRQLNAEDARANELIMRRASSSHSLLLGVTDSRGLESYVKDGLSSFVEEMQITERKVELSRKIKDTRSGLDKLAQFKECLKKKSDSINDRLEKVRKVVSAYSEMLAQDDIESRSVQLSKPK